eukprot:6307010-Lingulodinium_polyedra.AAC.1
MVSATQNTIGASCHGVCVEFNLSRATWIRRLVQVVPHARAPHQRPKFLSLHGQRVAHFGPDATRA